MVASALQANDDCFENAIIKLENNYCSDILTKVHNWSKTIIARLNKKNWVWMCMKIMCSIKGTDNELAFCGESSLYSQLCRVRGIHTCI